MKTIGVISDTHGLLRPEAISALRGSDMILHGGDVGEPGILQHLKHIAPVTAIRGNVDRGGWALALPETELVTVDGVNIYMLHDLQQLDIDPVVASVRVVISGHSHQPLIVERQGVLYLNPGSAGPRRFNLPITVARLVIDEGTPKAELIRLDA